MASERLCLDFSIKILYLVLYIKSPVPPYIYIYISNLKKA